MANGKYKPTLFATPPKRVWGGWGKWQMGISMAGSFGEIVDAAKREARDWDQTRAVRPAQVRRGRYRRELLGNRLSGRMFEVTPKENLVYARGIQLSRAADEVMQPYYREQGLTPDMCPCGCWSS